MRKAILFLFFLPFAVMAQTPPPVSAFAEVTIHRQWNYRKDVPALPGTSYSWLLPNDTVHYFKTDPGDGDQIVATVLFETYVPKREYDDVHGDLDYRLATGAQAPNLGDNVYNAVGWNHYNGNTVPYPAWTQGFYQKTVSYSQVRDQYILFTFTGKRVIVYGELSDNKGIAGFTIGNGPEILRDLYANTKVNNNQVIFTQDVTEGSHILKIRVTGNKNPSAVSGFVMIDKIVVE